MADRAVRWLLSVLVTLVVTSSHASQNDNYPFSVETEKSGDGHRIVARNSGPAPVSVKISLVDNRNSATDRPFPIFAVVPPGGGTLFLARIYSAVPGVGYSFSTNTSWFLGDLNARQSPDALYRLPYREGQAYRIDQAPGGPITSHSDVQSAYAVDISMPQGTPVVATRDGTVIYAEANQIYGGQSPDMMSKANEVRIQHIDGTIATYAHLAHGGVYAYPGQRVKSGDQIGLAGSTGYSSGPHLHFAVQTIVRSGDELKLVSLPFNFFIGNPASPVSVFAPSYRMQVVANYSTPALDQVKPSPVAKSPATRVAAGAPEMSITFAVPQTIRAFLLNIPVWGWISLMVGVVVIFIMAQKREDAARRRRRDLYIVGEPGIRSRSDREGGW